MLYQTHMYNSFVFITDIHLSDKTPINRDGDIWEISTKKLEWILNRASELEFPIIIGGDVFHSPCVDYRVLNDVIQLIKKYRVKIYSVVGNHDMIGANGSYEHTAIHTLFKAEVIEKLEFIENDYFFIKGFDYSTLIPAMNIDSDKYKIAVAHLSISPVSVPFNHILAKDVNTNADIIFLGHIHHSFDSTINGVRFINPGCIIRRTIQESDIEPSILIFNNGSVVIERIPFRGSFIKPKERIIAISDIIESIENKIDTYDIKTIIMQNANKEISDEINRRLIKKGA